VDAGARNDAAGRMRSYGAAESFDRTAVSVPDAVHRAHPDGVDAVIDTASDGDGFAALASLVRRGGTALTTKYVADVESLAQNGVTGVNFRLSMSPEVLERLADTVVSGRVVPPPIKRIMLGDVPAAWSNGRSDGKTVIVL
jgi:D-arabinose 1-dehydrogenase-like Zn-dependent alcohol dehydrogenase